MIETLAAGAAHQAAPGSTHPGVMLALVTLAVCGWFLQALVSGARNFGGVTSERFSWRRLGALGLSMAGYVTAWVALWGTGETGQPLILNVLINYWLELLLLGFGAAAYSIAPHLLRRHGAPAGSSAPSTIQGQS